MGGDIVAGAQLLDTNFDKIAQSDLGFRSINGLTLLAEALGRAGRIAEGLALVDAGIEQFEANCHTPELVRLKGELSLLHGRPGAAESAEIHFRPALDEAREHGALSWELRAATSLARLLLNQGGPADAVACLRPIYDRFTEGFSTADLIAAKQLLADLAAAGHSLSPPQASPRNAGRARAVRASAGVPEASMASPSWSRGAAPKVGAARSINSSARPFSSSALPSPCRGARQARPARSAPLRTPSHTRSLLDRLH
jgi:hypothetical protein